MARASSKSEESKLDKIKHFLGIRSSNRGNIHVGSVLLPRKDFAFTAELIKVSISTLKQITEALVECAC